MRKLIETNQKSDVKRLVLAITLLTATFSAQASSYIITNEDLNTLSRDFTVQMHGMRVDKNTVLDALIFVKHKHNLNGNIFYKVDYDFKKLKVGKAAAVSFINKKLQESALTPVCRKWQGIAKDSTNIDHIFAHISYSFSDGTMLESGYFDCAKTNNSIT